MRNLPLKSVFEFLETEEGLDVNEIDFISLARTALDRIGNKGYRIINHIKRVVDYEVEVPDGCFEIIQCSYLFEDSRSVNEESYYNNDYRDFVYEQNNETFNFYKSKYDLQGKIAKYQQIGNRLRFQENEFEVSIYCKIEVLDEEGLPFITEREKRAISDYISMIYFKKKSYATQNQFFFSVAEKKSADWNKSCAYARTSRIDNDIYDTISDVMTSWDRKHYNTTFKPIK